MVSTFNAEKFRKVTQEVMDNALKGENDENNNSSNENNDDDDNGYTDSSGYVDNVE